MAKVRDIIMDEYDIQALRHPRDLPQGTRRVTGGPMPTYEFLCEKCPKPFELSMTISEHEKGNVRCPTCKSTRVVPQLGSFTTQTAKKS
jgi:putative FmdB family regulatory protein